ncbi:MAG: extracellular catalytic domain type 2 short-chain-length polyhydroxyalkanoate depolymerase [Woeseiaceae bacterium]
MRVRADLLIFVLIVVALPVTSCSSDEEQKVSAAPAFNVDMSRVTVSGISAGAYMAGQLHFAHSAIFKGAGIIAGGPYRCASGSMQKGLGPCMKGGDVGLDELRAYVDEQAASGAIDPFSNIADDHVWVFHGTLDAIISKDVPTAALSFYERFLDAKNIRFVADIEAPHGMPTLDVGADCATVTTPFLNACNYDAAGELLQSLNGPMNPRTAAAGELLAVPQPDADDAEMLASALLYVPSSCTGGAACGVHVALHGCQQSVEFVGDAFAAGAGYNEWAESNNLLVLYPQAASSKIAPLNPMGCWDWWGYTGDDYATKSGLQVAAIMATLDSLSGSSP